MQKISVQNSKDLGYILSLTTKKGKEEERCQVIRMGYSEFIAFIKLIIGADNLMNSISGKEEFNLSVTITN